MAKDVLPLSSCRCRCLALSLSSRCRCRCCCCCRSVCFSRTRLTSAAPYVSDHRWRSVKVVTDRREKRYMLNSLRAGMQNLRASWSFINHTTSCVSGAMHGPHSVWPVIFGRFAVGSGSSFILASGCVNAAGLVWASSIASNHCIIAAWSFRRDS